MNKAELLEQIREERRRLDDVLAKLTEDELCSPVLVGGRSIKDTAAHLATWHRRVINATAAAGRGEPGAWPEPGYTVADTDRLNENDFLASRDRQLADVIGDWRAAYDGFLRWIDSYSDGQIASELPYTPGIKLEAIIRANGDEHYREHLDQIEAWWAGQGA